MSKSSSREITTGAKVEGGFGTGLFGLTFEEGSESALSAEEGGVAGVESGGEGVAVDGCAVVVELERAGREEE